jgi:hypothetical protein
MGVLRCDEREAFDAIVDAVHSTGLALGEVSRALIAVVGGEGARSDSPALAHWAAVIPARRR